MTRALKSHYNDCYEELFEQVQAVMAENRINRQHYDPKKSLLSGKLYDDKDNAMSPSWSTGSSGKKYRYYVSQAIIRKEPSKLGKIGKVSLPQLENFIDSWFNQLLREKPKTHPYIQHFEVSKQKKLLKLLFSYTITRDIEKALIKHIKLRPNAVEITLYTEQVLELFNAIYENREMRLLKPEELKQESNYTEPYHIGTIANGEKIIVGQFAAPKKRPNAELIKILNQAYTWHQDIINGASTQDIAKRNVELYLDNEEVVSCEYRDEFEEFFDEGLLFNDRKVNPGRTKSGYIVYRIYREYSIINICLNGITVTADSDEVVPLIAPSEEVIETEVVEEIFPADPIPVETAPPPVEMVEEIPPEGEVSEGELPSEEVPEE